MTSRSLIGRPKGLGATCRIHYWGKSEPEEGARRFLRNLGNYIVLCAYIFMVRHYKIINLVITLLFKSAKSSSKIHHTACGQTYRTEDLCKYV
jgi:hypothetical protein